MNFWASFKLSSKSFIMAWITRLILYMQVPVPWGADETGQGEEAEVPLQEAGGTPPSPEFMHRVQPLVKHVRALLQGQHAGAGYRIHQGEVGQWREENGAPSKALQTWPGHVPERPLLQDGLNRVEIPLLDILAVETETDFGWKFPSQDTMLTLQANPGLARSHQGRVRQPDGGRYPVLPLPLHFIGMQMNIIP